MVRTQPLARNMWFVTHSGTQATSTATESRHDYAQMCAEFRRTRETFAASELGYKNHIPRVQQRRTTAAAAAAAATVAAVAGLVVLELVA